MSPDAVFFTPAPTVTAYSSAIVAPAGTVAVAPPELQVVAVPLTVHVTAVLAPLARRVTAPELPVPIAVVSMTDSACATHALFDDNVVTALSALLLFAIPRTEPKVVIVSADPPLVLSFEANPVPFRPL